LASFNFLLRPPKLFVHPAPYLVLFYAARKRTVFFLTNVIQLSPFHRTVALRPNAEVIPGKFDYFEDCYHSCFPRSDAQGVSQLYADRFQAFSWWLSSNYPRTTCQLILLRPAPAFSSNALKVPPKPLGPLLFWCSRPMCFGSVSSSILVFLLQSLHQEPFLHCGVSFLLCLHDYSFMFLLLRSFLYLGSRSSLDLDSRSLPCSG